METSRKNFVMVSNLSNCFIVSLSVGLTLNKEFKKNSNIGFTNPINGYRHMCACRAKKKISSSAEKAVNKSTYLAPMYTCNTLSKFSLHHSSTSTAKVALNMARLTLLLLQA